MDKTKNKPLPARLNRQFSQVEIIYRCPCCNTLFALYGYQEKFCHNCGTAIDWNVVIAISEKEAESYELDFHNPNSHKDFFDKIQEINKTIEQGPKFLQCYLGKK